MNEENTYGYTHGNFFDIDEVVDDIVDEKNGASEEKAAPAPDGKAEIVGVKFRGVGKEYFFSPGSLKLNIGDRVITETVRGMELGEITRGNELVNISETVAPLKTVLRKASPSDVAHFKDNMKLEEQALEICEEQVLKHELDMKLTGAEYTFDNKKLIFYFTSDGRVDFRDLVKDLASVFRTRIELRQIGIRDEAKMIGGLGICGRPFCCSTFLSDFGQVSIKMAKDQNLSLNSSNISGPCGRLMCCLRYEQETYEEEARLTPKVGSYVHTPDGNGTVVDSNPLAGKVKVKLTGNDDGPAEYSRDDVSVTEKKEEDIAAERAAAERREQKEAQAAEREAKRAKRSKPKRRKYIQPDFSEESNNKTPEN